MEGGCERKGRGMGTGRGRCAAWLLRQAAARGRAARRRGGRQRVAPRERGRELAPRRGCVRGGASGLGRRADDYLPAGDSFQEAGVHTKKKYLSAIKSLAIYGFI